MDIAQLAARRSHNPKVVSSILTIHTIFVAAMCEALAKKPWSLHQATVVAAVAGGPMSSGTHGLAAMTSA